MGTALWWHSDSPALLQSGIQVGEEDVMKGEEV